MGDANDLLKLVTERVVKYLTTPAEEKEARKTAKSQKLPWATRWFGVAPMGMQLWWENKRHKEKPRIPEV